MVQQAIKDYVAAELEKLTQVYATKEEVAEHLKSYPQSLVSTRVSLSAPVNSGITRVSSLTAKD